MHGAGDQAVLLGLGGRRQLAAAAGLAVADEVRRLSAENEISIAGRLVRCTLSGGVSAYPDSGVTVNDLFHAADLSLLAAKRAGRDQVRLSAPRASV